MIKRLERALDGDSHAMMAVVRALSGEVHFGVALAMDRERRLCGRSRMGREGLIQEVFVSLMEDDARTLRRWDPERTSLSTYVRLSARWRARELLRNDRRKRSRETVLEPTDMDALAATSSSEARSLATNELDSIERQMRSRLRPLGFQIFWWLFVEERSVEEVQVLARMKAPAVHQWRRRLKVLAWKFAGSISDSCAGG